MKSSLPLISTKVVSPCIVMTTTKSHHNVKALVTMKTLLLKKPLDVHSLFITNNASSSSYIWRKLDTYSFHKNNSTYNLFLKSSLPLSKKVISPCIVMATTKSHHNVKALVSVKKSDDGLLKNLVTGIVGNNHLVLELVSSELDPNSKGETIKGKAHEIEKTKDNVLYEATFELPTNFGNVGAVLVENEHNKEIFLKNIVLDGFPDGPVHLNCQSWIQPKHDTHTKRVFFTNKMYLPSQTPSGLRKLRENELIELRGNGEGERKSSDRIYDYDVYNDLGDPDTNIALKRPVLGGSKQYPYPRRCRTGRKHSNTGDKFFWLSDEEFARETLAGANPNSIQLVKEWPLRSKLESQIYGSPESAITREVVESQIIGYTTVEEVIQEKKLFMLDYHDLYLPYVSKVRELKNTTLYGSRTLFFLTKQGTLKPLVIELTRPIIGDKPQWKQIFTPAASDSTNLWLWRLAKTHVLAHDIGYHELINHWLRTHCVVEPFVIATNRQLSTMHPIYKLLHPHLRYTLEINSLAREILISANGVIEDTFFPKKYSMELSSVAYDKLWQFDLQGLPNDLINRGMAVEDSNAQHGLKLAIEDYPFANDGLLIWDAIKQWVTDYVNHYYPSPSIIESDQELQAWWTEVRTKGHSDKSEEPWWPNLKTQKDLVDIITTIAWIASAHHSATNFAQYAYGGYFPNRPTIARNNMPTEDPTKEEWEKFVNKPEQTLLECFPSQIQATLVMTILNILSYHSPDEEYLGQLIEPSWAENPTIKVAFEKFNGRLKEIEGIIDSRNANSNLKNRNGAGIVPYELMKPFSGPGITGKGVPYSISI
ncbi:linoleate 13S-lipoxygenase 2-1, chloroplastic-like isoform X8 [Trifolium pratense]|uniref:linoleate 13S-lipoxygenase 2-1, chloroplastic-like isoform X8 n=1 Tax=Trifolium pratense TaxID=57577 RepID=UPI001E691F64|nr:linoleate 13S-lipoxygenase 2-1, chloroplastic-like isoform X8 [Trifolium pratense]